MLLSSASQRNDQCLERSKSLKGSAAQKLAEKLIAAGFIREIKAKVGAPVWRLDDEAEQSYSLKLTAAGVRAIAVDDERGESAPSASDELAPPMVAKELEIAIAADTSALRASPLATAPRGGTEIAQLIALLQRD